MTVSSLVVWDGIDAVEAEGRLLSLKRRQAELEPALQAQWQIQKIHSKSFAVSLAGKSLETRRDLLSVQVADLLKYRRYEAVQISLDGEQFHDHSANIGNLGVFLIRLQKLYSAIAQSMQTGPTLRGPIASFIQEATELRLTRVFDSSFGMDLYVPSRLDLAGRSISSEALTKMFDLLSSSVSEKKVMELSGELGGRATNHLRHLVSHLSGSDSAITVGWSDYTGTAHKWSASREVTQQARANLRNISQVSSSVKTYVGLLGGGSIFRNSFELFDQETKTLLEGNMVANLVPLMKQYFGTVCTATVDETEVLDRASGDKKVYYVLTDINNANTSFGSLPPPDQPSP